MNQGLWISNQWDECFKISNYTACMRINQLYCASTIQLFCYLIKLIHSDTADKGDPTLGGLSLGVFNFDINNKSMYTVVHLLCIHNSNDVKILELYLSLYRNIWQSLCPGSSAQQLINSTGLLSIFNLVIWYCTSTFIIIWTCHGYKENPDHILN